MAAFGAKQNKLGLAAVIALKIASRMVGFVPDDRRLERNPRLGHSLTPHFRNIEPSAKIEGTRIDQQAGHHVHGIDRSRIIVGEHSRGISYVTERRNVADAVWRISYNGVHATQERKYRPAVSQVKPVRTNPLTAKRLKPLAQRCNGKLVASTAVVSRIVALCIHHESPRFPPFNPTETIS